MRAAEQRVQVVLVTRNSRIRQVDLHVIKAGTAQLLAQMRRRVQLAQVRYIQAHRDVLAVAVRARELGQHQTARAQVLKAQTAQVHAHHATARNAHRVHAQLGQILQTVVQVRALRRARIQRDVVARRKVQSISDQSPSLAFINAHCTFHCRSAQVDRVHVQTGFAQPRQVALQVAT